MSDCKHLVYSILQFLDQQKTSGGLGEDACESLEVATQCLESAYGISMQDEGCRAAYPQPASLEEMFAAQLAIHGQKVCTTGPVVLLTDEGALPAEVKEQAEKHKAEGNEFMKQDKFAEAIDCYMKAIELDSNNAVYYCNRAAAHSKMNKHEDAVADCKKAIEIDPSYGKAYGRKGLAHAGLNQHKEAVECYRKALELDPGNSSYIQNMEIAQQKAQEGNPPMVLGGMNLGGMDFTSMLSNPALMNMATNMMQNPQMQQMMAGMVSGAQNQGGQGPQGIANLLQAGQQLAQQMQQTNPELVEQLRTQMRDPDPSDPNPEN